MGRYFLTVPTRIAHSQTVFVTYSSFQDRQQRLVDCPVRRLGPDLDEG